jgi:hypothetical protein
VQFFEEVVVSWKTESATLGSKNWKIKTELSETGDLLR